MRRLTALMRRRGPDDEGLWLDPKGRVQFGFARLAILDLTSNAHQPMCTQDGRYVLVYNGEVYNFASLRTELEGHDEVFQSTGDTEVVLKALARWGAPALDRFNGMFALALYDTTRRSLLLARDHAGIKPLYYPHTEEGLVFGSQYDQLRMAPLDSCADSGTQGCR